MEVNGSGHGSEQSLHGADSTNAGSKADEGGGNDALLRPGGAALERPDNGRVCADGKDPGGPDVWTPRDDDGRVSGRLTDSKASLQKLSPGDVCYTHIETSLLQSDSVLTLAECGSFACSRPDVDSSPVASSEAPVNVPRWRLWVVQWDISHTAIALAFAAFALLVMTVHSRFRFSNVDSDGGQGVILPKEVWYTAWFIGLTVAALNAVLVVLRVVVDRRSVWQDLANPRLANFFFSPIIVGGVLILSTPPFMYSRTTAEVFFWLFSVAQTSLAAYLLGTWMCNAEKSATRSIHPLFFMQVIGFFILSSLGSTLRYVSLARFLFSVGALFWVLVFATVFQNMATVMCEKTEQLQPSIVLMIAPPAQAAISCVLLSHVERAAEQDLRSALEFSRLAESVFYVDLFLLLILLRLAPKFARTSFGVV